MKRKNFFWRRYDPAMVDSPSTNLLFISSITLSSDPDPTERKKWSKFSSLYSIYVICFGENGFGMESRYGVRFIYYPSNLPLPLRLAAYYFLTPFIASYVTIRRATNVWIVQSPLEAGAVWFPSLLFQSIGDTRMIIEAHGDWIESFFELRSVPYERFVKCILRLYSYIVINRADGLRSVSQQTRELLNQYCSHSCPHSTFPTFTNLDVFLETSLSEKTEAESSFIAYVGALTHLKGLEDMFLALKKCRAESMDIPLRIVGEGPQRSFFERRVKELELSNLVDFTGYVEQARIRELLVKARFLVLPSHTEGMPRVLIEALACYTPYVCTETPGGVELTEKSRGGITVPLEDPETLAGKIKSLYKNEKKRREMGTRGRRYVEENYSVEAYFSNYKELINSVL